MKSASHCPCLARCCCVDDTSRSSSTSTFSAAVRPKTTSALTSGQFVRGRVESRKVSSSNQRATDGQNCDHQKGCPSPQQQEKQQQAAEICGVHSERSMGGGAEGTPRTARSVVEETQSLPRLQHIEAVVAPAENRDAGRARGCFASRTHDETHGNSESCKSGAPSAREPKCMLSTRPSTAPVLFDKLLHLPDHDGVGVERGRQRSVTASTAQEGPTTATPGGDAAASTAGSKRSDNGGDGSSFRHTPRKRRGLDGPEETRPCDTLDTTAPLEDAQHLTARKIFDTELDRISPVNHRPSTAEAQRRRSIEVDAALSRSPRLPPPSCSLTLGSEDDFTLLTGSMIGELGGAKFEREERSSPRARYFTETGEHADVGPGVDITITGLTGHRAKTRSSGRKAGVRSSREGGGLIDSRQRTKSTTKGRSRRQKGGRASQPNSSRQTGQHTSSSGSGSRPIFSDSQISSTTARARATGTTWTQWRRPGDLGELDLRADFLHCTYRRGARRKVLGRAANGAAAGVGWGGYEQVRTKETVAVHFVVTQTMHIVALSLVLQTAIWLGRAGRGARL